MTRPHRTGLTRCVHNATLYHLDNGFWEDEMGTLYSIPDPQLAVDKHSRAGVGLASLPASHFLSEAAPMHDHMFTSPVYQAFNSMEEANEWYLTNARILGKGKRFYLLWLTLAKVALKVASSPFWDNKETLRRSR